MREGHPNWHTRSPPMFPFEYSIANMVILGVMSQLQFGSKFPYFTALVTTFELSNCCKGYVLKQMLAQHLIYSLFFCPKFNHCFHRWENTVCHIIWFFPMPYWHDLGVEKFDRFPRLLLDIKRPENDMIPPLGATMQRWKIIFFLFAK